MYTEIWNIGIPTGQINLLTTFKPHEGTEKEERRETGESEKQQSEERGKEKERRSNGRHTD